MMSLLLHLVQLLQCDHRPKHVEIRRTGQCLASKLIVGYRETCHIATLVRTGSS